MITLEKKLCKLLNDAPNPFIYKIFLYIVLNQPDEGVHGLRITKEQLAVALNAGKSSIFRDLKWLKDNLLIQEIKFVEDFDYMANPHFVMNNSDFQERMNEWNRRCRIDIQHELELKHKRRLKAARKQKNRPDYSSRLFCYINLLSSVIFSFSQQLVAEFFNFGEI